MLPYETERHARMIFSRLLATPLADASHSSSIDTAALADAALRMAGQFSAALETYQARLPQQHPMTRSACPSFEELAKDWLRQMSKTWKPAQQRNALRAFEKYLFPRFGDRPANELTSADVLGAVQAVEDAGYVSRAHELCHHISRIYRFGAASGYAIADPAGAARGGLPQWRQRPHATILLPRRIGELLRAIDRHGRDSPANYLVRLLPLVFLRPLEIRTAEWPEIDFKHKQWRIPARRMKMRRPHIVPLARQTINVLRELHRITGRHRYLFPSSRTKRGVISNSMCAQVLTRAGFAREMTLSGFRSMAATLLSEMGWSADAIEKQLSHLDPAPSRRAYNFAEYLPERTRMMQSWADHLDQLRRLISREPPPRAAHI